MYYQRKCKITFISHGATIYSEDGRLSNVENYPPLSELGVEEITNVINYLKNRGVKNDYIYTSPAIRTVQSAMMISKALKKEYSIVDELTTRNYGIWNGQTVMKLLEKYPNGLSEALVQPDESMAGVENSQNFVSRIGNVINNLVETNIGNRIIIITYPEIIQASIVAALELPIDKMHKIFIRTGSLTQISYYKNWSSLLYSDYIPL